MRKLLLTIAILIAAALPHPTGAVSGCDGAGNCYVRAAATGAGTGADWTNAYTGFGTGAGQVNPASLTRGVNYYVAGGTYNASSTTTFSTAASGTTLITILAPTIASHGTATGWSNAYQSQAVFGPILIASNYWTLDGVYRGSGTGLPATDWRTGYGFKVNNSNGSGGRIGASGIWAGDSSPDEADHVTVEYFEVQGSGDTTGTVQDGGITFNFAQFPVILFNFVHDTGSTNMTMDSITTDIIEYNWMMNDQSCQSGVGGCTSGHAEGIAIRGMNNLTFAYNYMENEEGTGYIGTPCPGSSCFNGSQDTWNFYGNVFFANTSEWHGNCASGCTRTGIQDGLSTDVIQFFGGPGDNAIWTAMNWWNNTIYAIGGDASSNGPGQCDFSNSVSTTAKVISFVFQNNIGGNCTKVGMPNLGSGSIGTGTLTQDHNTYCNVGTITDTGAALQTLATCSLFNSPSTNNFSLATDTSAWTSLSSPFNVDTLGNARTTSRGAFQFSPSTATLTPAIYTFASTAVGSTSSDSPVTFTLTNNTGVTVTGITISFTGAAPGDFTDTTSCGTTLAGSASCQIFVTFTPTATGTRTATLSVSDSASSSPQTSSLSGTAIPSVINPSPANPVTFGIVVTDPSIPSTVKNEKHHEDSSAYDFCRVALVGFLHQDRAYNAAGVSASQ
jgi:hypothetical protein